jgi:hypothetical protein
MESVDVLSGSVRVRHDNNVTQFTILVLDSPAVSLAPSPEVDVSVEADTNPFLDSVFLRRSFYEDVVVTNVVLRTLSSPLVRKKDKMDPKKFKY